MATTYDTVRDRVLGVLEDAGTMQMWSWDGQWTRLADPDIASTPLRSIAFDSARDRAIHFGGALAQDGLYEFDGESWSQIPKTTPWPSGRRFFPMAYDPDRQRTVLYGGIDTGCTGLSDTWEWDGQSWYLASTSGPGALTSGELCYDPLRQQMLLFGGIRGCNGVPVDGLWAWDGIVWTQLTDAATSPPARRDPRMVFDPLLAGVVMFGGSAPGGGPVDGSTWLWDGMKWAEVDLPGPGPRGGAGNVFHAMTYDAARQQVLLFGGADANGTLLGDTWILRPSEPVITDQPQGVLLAYPGGLAQFNVVAEAGPQLAYTWRRDGQPLEDGASITGASTPTLTVFATESDEAIYDCVVSNGNVSVVSEGAILGVRGNPCTADLAAPFGTLTFADIAAFLAEFSVGCP